MKKNILFVLVMIAGIFFLQGCDKKDLCELPSPHPVDVALKVDFNSMWDKEIIHTKGFPESGALNLDMRYILESWEVDADGNLLRMLDRFTEISGTLKSGQNTHDFAFRCPATTVAILCWAEPVEHGSQSNPNFNADSLTKVKMVNPLSSYNEHKDAFAASVVWDLAADAAPTIPHVVKKLDKTLTLLRPFARYQVVTTDVSIYKEQQGDKAVFPSRSVIDYMLWIPTMYDVYTQRALGAFENASYDFVPVELVPDKEWLLGENVLFVGPNDGEFVFYHLSPSCYKPNGDLLHQGSTAELKMQRNKMSLLRGKFLTDRGQNSPGIDDSFDEVIDHILPD